MGYSSSLFPKTWITGIFFWTIWILNFHPTSSLPVPVPLKATKASLNDVIVIGKPELKDNELGLLLEVTATTLSIMSDILEHNSTSQYAVVNYNESNTTVSIITVDLDSFLALEYANTTTVENGTDTPGAMKRALSLIIDNAEDNHVTSKDEERRNIYVFTNWLEIPEDKQKECFQVVKEAQKFGINVFLFGGYSAPINDKLASFLSSKDV